MAAGTWQDLGGLRVGDGSDLVISIPYVPTVTRQFYRLALTGGPLLPAGFVLIPAGTFQMGDQSYPLEGNIDELPVHAVQLSAFYMAKYETSQAEWDAVLTWGLANGYPDLPPGSGVAENHPVSDISWYEIVKWCNARSQKENLTPCYTVSGAVYKIGSSPPACNWSANGYRLPTEAEWEKAARGGQSGKSFPWGGNTITHSQATYHSTTYYSYDVSPTRGYHPIFGISTAPVGSFPPNGYGLYDMAGNMWEWCWDRVGSYSASSQSDPRGSTTGSDRANRGGGCDDLAEYCRVAFRGFDNPVYSYGHLGFRVARSAGP